jgi:hypothetical protein
MNFFDIRTSAIDDARALVFDFGGDGGRNSVRPNDDGIPFFDFRKTAYSFNSRGFEPSYDLGVMNDFPERKHAAVFVIFGGKEGFFDGAPNAGAKTYIFGYNYVQKTRPLFLF